MLGKLIVYELIKKWKSSKFLLLGYVLVQTILLFIIRVFLWNNEIGNGFTVSDNMSVSGSGVNASFALLTMLFFLLALFLGAYPFVESIYRYERDLSGKQAYLELMIPAVGWKKVLSKLIATMAGLIICGTLSLFSMFAYVMVNSNFRYLMDMLRLLGEIIAKNGIDAVLLILFMLFSFASGYMIIFFCISVAKSFTHKNTIAVPIGIFVFVILTVFLGYLGTQVNKVPIINYNLREIEFTLSSTLLDIAVLFAALMGTSWLIEKRIEH